MRTTHEIQQKLHNIASKLRLFTKECRDDMHEPDEQDVSAKVVGKYLDNAGGESGEFNEINVILKKGKEIFKINLATLIAIARLA